MSAAIETRGVLVACVGNVLRGDDGFGPAVAARLEQADLPGPSTVLETGIGGIALIQELMLGYDGLVLVDAVDRGAEPGTVFVLSPEVGDAVHVADVHLANPERVLTYAKAMGHLPARVAIVGCQPQHADLLGQALSSPVEAAVDVAVERIEELLRAWV